MGRSFNEPRLENDTTDDRTMSLSEQRLNKQTSET